MKKILAAIAMVGVMAMSLAACGGDTSSSSDAGTPSTPDTSISGSVSTPDSSSDVSDDSSAA